MGKDESCWRVLYGGWQGKYRREPGKGMLKYTNEASARNDGGLPKEKGGGTVMAVFGVMLTTGFGHYHLSS